MLGGALAPASGWEGVWFLSPLWCRAMDPEVVEQYGSDIAQANLQPERAGTLLKNTRPPSQPISIRTMLRSPASDKQLSVGLRCLFAGGYLQFGLGNMAQ